MESLYYSKSQSLRFDISDRPLTSLSSIINGDIYIWKQGLQQLGLLDGYLKIIYRQIASISSETVCAAIARQGLEYIHHHLSVPQIFKLDKALINDFAGQARTFLNRSFEITPPDPEACYYYADQSWIRILVPEDLLIPHTSLVQNELGHLVVHNPHRDSWFSQASNVINFWIAIGDVRKGNSVLIYPESYYEELLTDNSAISYAQKLNAPLNFNMQAGDVLFFHGDHLHSSELNITNQTRFVLSYRLTYGKPQYAHEDNQFEYKPL